MRNIRRWILNIGDFLRRHWIAIAVTWVFAGFILLFIYIGLYGEVTWEVLTGFATWILAGGVFLAVGQAIITRENVKKSNSAQLAVELFRELRSDEMLSTLRLIYRLNDDIPKICITDKNNIGILIDKFEMLGALVNQEIIDDNIAIEAFGGPPALRCWYKLASYMRDLEQRRGYYITHYESFVRRTVEYFEKKHVEVLYYRSPNKEDEGIPLVQEFRKLINSNDRLRPRTLKEIREERERRKVSNMMYKRGIQGER